MPLITLPVQRRNSVLDALCTYTYNIYCNSVLFIIDLVAGENTFGSIRVCVCVSVCLWALSCLNCLTFDLDF